MHVRRTRCTVALLLALLATPVLGEPPQCETIRVAAISFVPKKFDLRANADCLERAFRAAKKGGAAIAVGPEGALDGYVVNEIIAGKRIAEKMKEVAIAADGPTITRFRRLACELKMCLVFGFAERIDNDVFNAAVFIDHQGTIRGKYHKMQFAEGYDPAWWFNRLGRSSRAFDTPYGRCGLLICNDRWNPRLARIPVLDGAQFLIIPSFGSRSRAQDKAVLSRGKENQVPVIEANVGVTLVVNEGRVVARDRHEEGITFGEITIPPAANPRPKKRDQLEQKFLKWRTAEMKRRLAKTQQRLRRKQSFDIVILHGKVIDGSGKAAFRADVGIGDGRILALGKLDGATAKEVIDATGRIVCPGFIDLHSHADRGILQFRRAENYIRQGATTLVCGNCGSSPTDVGGFFDRLRDGGAGPNIAMLIGHGSVRREVIGPLNAPPSKSQIAEMQRLVGKAMREGAVGMSTGLRYSPGAYADTDEVVALAKEVSAAGGFYATHMRDEGTRILEALEEALDIGEKANVPVHISHHKISSVSVFGLTRSTLARIEQARKEGMDVTLDQYPYGAGSGGMSLYVPQESLSGGLEAFRKRVADPRQRKSIIAGVEELLVRKIYAAADDPRNVEQTAAALARIQVARAEHDSKLEGKNLTQILRSRKQDLTLQNGAELLVELVGQGARGINHTLDAQPGGDVDRVMQHPLTAIASDGGAIEFGRGNPHPRSYGCYPRVLAHYVRQRKLLTLEQAVHKMTALPAQRLGWSDRGEIKRGAWADVVVFDPKTVADKATFSKPHQYAVGIEHTIVNGRFVLKSGKMTGELPGKPVGLQGPL